MESFRVQGHELHRKNRGHKRATVMEQSWNKVTSEQAQRGGRALFGLALPYFISPYPSILPFFHSSKQSPRTMSTTSTATGAKSDPNTITVRHLVNTRALSLPPQPAKAYTLSNPIPSRLRLLRPPFFPKNFLLSLATNPPPDRKHLPVP